MQISNRNSFRVLFDKIASVCFTWKNTIYILAVEMASTVIAWKNIKTGKDKNYFNFQFSMCIRAVWRVFKHSNTKKLGLRHIWVNVMLIAV